MVKEDSFDEKDFAFNADSVMGEMIKRFDWSKTRAGAFETWPPCLFMMLRTILDCQFPMLLCWGADLIQFYNDAYMEVLSKFGKHPSALGQPVHDCWQEIWLKIEPLINQVLVDRKSNLTVDFPFPFYNNNKKEETYWTFSISPAYDHMGSVAGVFLICNETTDLVKNRRHMSQLLEHEQAVNEELFATNEELTEANAALVLANEEIHLAELQLRESENKYRALFQLSPLPMWIYDPLTLKVLEVNEMAVNKYGYSRQEFVNKDLRDIRPVSEIPEFLAAQKRIKNYKELQLAGTFRHLKKNGDMMMVEVYGHNFEYQGKECVMVVANDITEKEKALSLLKDNQERLTSATAIAKLGYWQVDLDGTNRYWSDEVLKIWDMPQNTDLNDWDCLLQKVHPDDKNNFSSEQQASLAAVKEIDLEYRLLLSDGTVKWVHEIGKIVRDEHGKACKIRGTIQDITAQKLLALSIRESNERFQYAAQATSQAIWEWDAARPGIFKEYGYYELFGHQLPGNMGEVAFWRSKVHPDDYQRIWSAMEVARQNPNTYEWTLEYRFKKSDGHYLFLKEKAILLRDQQGVLLRMIGSMHDITRRKNEERQLKLLESVITNTLDGVLVTLASPLDEPGPTIIYANESVAKMTGYTVSELLGETPRILQGPRSDKTELQRLKRALKLQQPCEISIINYKKNGEEYWVNISVSPMRDEKGVVSHYIAIQRDVTEKKKAEAAFKLFADDLYKRNQELQQFGYLVSHNLRAPVANIIGISDLLELDKDEPATVEKCAQDLKLSVTRLDDVIRDMSKILSITENSVELIKQPVNLTEMLKDILADLKDSIDRSEAEINFPASSHTLVSHKAYLYSVFYNLITNAIKYRSRKKPVIKINITQKKNAHLIEFTDNGIGIDLSRHSGEIFKPYRRFHHGTEGKGLGLFLVKSHIEALKGTVTIESEPGNGTTFKILMPTEEQSQS